MRSRKYASTLPRSNSSSSRTFMVSVTCLPLVGGLTCGYSVSYAAFRSRLCRGSGAQLASFTRGQGVARAARGGVADRGAPGGLEEPRAAPGALEGVGPAPAVAVGEVQRHP